MAKLSEEHQNKLLRLTSPKSSDATAAASTTASGSSSSCQCGTAVSATEEVVRRSIKPKSSSARLVYRVLLLSHEHRVEGVVQVISDPIRCSKSCGFWLSIILDCLKIASTNNIKSIVKVCWQKPCKVLLREFYIFFKYYQSFVSNRQELAIFHRRQKSWRVCTP